MTGRLCFHQSNSSMRNYLSILALLIVGCNPCQPNNSSPSPSSETPTVARLECKVLRDADEHPADPFSEVYLLVGENKLKVADISVCLVFERPEFPHYGIPDTALSAAGGWWAGAGNYFYLIAEGDKYKVQYASSDEADGGRNLTYSTILMSTKEGELVAPQ